MLSRMFSPIFRRLAFNSNGSIVGHIFRVSRHQFLLVFSGPSFVRDPPPLGFFIVSTPETMAVLLDPY